MKKLMRTFALMAVAALGLNACTGEKLVPDNGNADGKFVTVHFGAEAAIEGATKATLKTEDELRFNSAWENGDVLSVKYSFDYGAAKETTATWSAEKSCFEAQMDGGKGDWTYDALYPAPNAEKKVDFGSARTQNGSAYNSKFDLMKGGATAENADAGKTAEGGNIVFNMTRQTAIAYFHFTSTLDEEVVSAKLSVEGATAYLSTSEVKANEDYAKGYAFTKTEGVASKEINLTFDAGTAPKTSGFKLWFNVLPTDYDKMTLTVETANHTLTISRNATGKYEAGKLYKVVKNIPADKWVKKGGETPAQASWIATDLADITATDEVVITMAKGESVYAMTSDNGTKNPQAVLVTVKNGELSATPADNLVWNIANDNGNLTIYPNGQTDKWLSAVSGKTDVKVGNFTTTKIFTLDATTKYLKNTGANRYLGVYNNTDWRAYASTTGSSNIAGQTLCFYVKGTPKTALETPANLAVSAAKVVSWDAVSGAASYEVAIGKDVFTSETNSYDATTVVDDYYDVAVVAIPTDKENYKNSAAATLSGAKFGTPTLATPTLKEGVVDGASISVSWTVDERATAGYNCELFKGEVKVGEGQIVKVGTVTFTGLDAETAYVVKVNAVAVEGTKAYAASPVATLDVTTKAASAAANDGSLEHPYTAAEAIAVIDASPKPSEGVTNKYVKGIVKAASSFDARFSSLTYDIESGEKTLNIYSGKDLGNAGFVGAEDLKAGDEVVVFGTLKKYDKTYELDKNNHLISINGKTEIYRGLAVSGQKTSFNVGDAFEFGGKVLQVWRGKEDVDVTASATFSGYDKSTEGKQTITVTVGEETVTYEITVNPAGTVPPVIVSKKISEISGTTTSGTQVSSMTMDDVITLTASTKGNNGKVYINNGITDWRLYQGDSGTMTVSSKAGYVIESITVTFNISKSGTLLYNNNVVTSGKAVAVSGSSVKFTLGNSSTAKNGQIRVTAVSVTYKQQ